MLRAIVTLRSVTVPPVGSTSGLGMNLVSSMCSIILLPHSSRCAQPPNNLLSDKDVAISNIAGYCDKSRVRNCPCPLVPLLSFKTHGSVSGRVSAADTSRPGAYHSIVQQLM